MSTQPVRGYLGISEVLAELRAEFPDISVSKIRFLETEGLVTPARSPAGYRRFTAQDVDRLRLVLAAQRDQYLPLRVIRERLAQLDKQSAASGHSPPAWPVSAGTGSAGPVPAGPAHVGPVPAAQRAAAAHPARSGRGADAGRADRAGGLPDRASGRADRASGRPGAGFQDGAQADSEPLLSRRELVEAAGLSEALLTELETFGLIRRIGRQYSPESLEVARTAKALTSFGVEARHLRAVRAAAERETTMIESLVAPILRQRGPGARELAGRTARDCAELVLRLHGALVEGTLAEAGFPAAGLRPAADHGPAASGEPATGRQARGMEGASA
jgi:DNA-binding transcriptional MerR regulator